MGMFVEIRINPNTCRAAAGCDLCVQICPAEIFHSAEKRVSTIYDNEDECTFCDLCVDQCPCHSIEVIKLY
jgi:Na+-translocating ferredoxin:NAD+ oxidoreductase RNF subunit RnfB